jgi:putative SOS response-associated peptidase YedK
MCGRMVLTRSAEEIAADFDEFEGETGFEWPPRYNLAPSQDLLAIRADPEGRARFVQLRWGLIPSWAREASIGHRLINARSETVSEKPSFRSAFRSRRCLIPADGFYEWLRPASGDSRLRAPSIPHFFRRRDGLGIMMAGLWETWADRTTGECIDSCTILTTSANADVVEIHHRMPVLLKPNRWTEWLDPELKDARQIEPMLAPAASGTLEHFAVGTQVNHPRHDAPDCIEPAA